jgi:transposase
MAIDMEIYEKIRYMHEREGMSQRAIARTLGVSRNTVKKYCQGSHVPWQRQGVSGRKPYVITDEVTSFIKECFEHDDMENIRNQKHTAKRIYDRLVSEKGFTGGESTVREVVAKLRPKQPKVFIPLEFDPGEAIQIDWGEAKVYIAEKKTKVHVFCMRDCYSGDIFCNAYYRPNEESFLEAQINGFEFMEGIPKRCIFDNAKVAVKDGFGAYAKVQDRYRVMAAHYAFECVFCNIRAGHEKGLVEGLVGWMRRNIFVPVPKVDTISELNNILVKRCLKYRKHTISGRNMTVGEMASISRTQMTDLPPYKFDSSKTVIARVNDYSLVRFDRNDYSVPISYAGKNITVKGFGNEVKMMYRNHEIERYPRCYHKGKTHYRLEHYIDLIEKRPRSVYNAKPVRENVCEELMTVGKRLSGPREMVKLLRLLADYDETKLLHAIHSIKGYEITVDRIREKLQPCTPGKLKTKIDVEVTKTQLDRYDALMERITAL